jgi:DNA-directed RNA polymerase alpha subunit
MRTIQEYRDLGVERQRRETYWRERGLSVRGTNCLVNSDIFTVEALQQRSWAELWIIPNLGRRTLLEIITAFGVKDAPKGSGWPVEWPKRFEILDRLRRPNERWTP